LEGTAQDQSVFFKEAVALPGPAMTSDYNFNSDISRGIIYYETPSMSQLVGAIDAKKVSYYDPTIFLLGPTSSDGSQKSYT
jgi:hypothetical protein